MGIIDSLNESGQDPNDRTRIDGKIYTRERMKQAKGNGVTYDQYINWLMDEAAEKYGTDGEAPKLERVGNDLIVRTTNGEATE